MKTDEEVGSVVERSISDSGGIRRKLTIALMGNPNSGKTSLFNVLTGTHQHVGNWGGVTVDVKVGETTLRGRSCSLIDLPGTYSLSAYSLEEQVARDYLLEEKPDVVVNVIDATNLERNLYLTVQLFELGIRPVVALNMWDEVQQKGVHIVITQLAELLDVPIITTVGKTGVNGKLLLEEAFNLADRGETTYRRHGVEFPAEVEQVIDRLAAQQGIIALGGLPRWSALKVLENDTLLREKLQLCEDYAALASMIQQEEASLQRVTGDDAQNLIAEARYGFIAGALRETVKKPVFDRREVSEVIDSFLTHQFWAFPIFFVFMWLLFQATFVLGVYPQKLFEMLIAALGSGVTHLLPESLVRSLIVEGIIGGVGGVIVFLPNILILFFGIAIMEDTGYMARAAFITDKIMHKVGLHGKSFIPMLMGLGCSVPAIMAARTLESPIQRRKTILLAPLISCSARLPVYILFAGALFPRHAGNVVFLFQFVFGTLAFFVMAYIFKKTIFREEDQPFVMELPPYRLPTLKSVFIHMWLRAEHFLKKMGGVVLVFSVVIWALGKFPQDSTATTLFHEQVTTVHQSTLLTIVEKEHAVAQLEGAHQAAQIKNSCIGRIGIAILPFFKPLGFEWREAVSLLTGFIAKEIVVSSMGVLYASSDGTLANSEALISEVRKNFTPLKGVAFMFFVLLYTPCIVTVVTVVKELQSIPWSIFSVGYQIVLAWIVAFVVFQGGRLIGFN